MRNLLNSPSRAPRAVAALFAALFLASLSHAFANHRSANLVDRLERDGRFTTLLAALDAAGLKDTVATGGTFTVFAPTDDAFAALPPGTVDSLITNVPALQNVLLYHVLPGRASISHLLRNSTAETLQGTPVLVVKEDSKVLVNRQPVSLPWITAANGVIYPLRGVLLPPAAPADILSVADLLALDGRFNTLLAAVSAAGLANALTTGGPFTLFAPTDDAFAALPPGTVDAFLQDTNALREILLYHVLGEARRAGGLLDDETATTLQGFDVSIRERRDTLYVNDARVLNKNVQAPNAIVHVIDAVLLPPPDLLEALQADGRFTTLVAALTAAGLDTVIATQGPFTVFAPTDEAFAALPPGTVDALLQDTNALRHILLYHVVDEELSARKLEKERKVETLQGDKVRIRSPKDRLYVNDARVIDADLKAGNGTIHAISAVLLPRTDD